MGRISSTAATFGLGLVALSLACQGSGNTQGAGEGTGSDSETGLAASSSGSTGGAGSGGPASESSTSETSAIGTSSTGEAEDTSSTGGPTEGPCGDGTVNIGEVCDDGNDDDTDACTSACLEAVCGDGFVQPVLGETCDDGNVKPDDGCDADCSTPGAVVWDTTVDVAGGHDQGNAVAVGPRGALVVTGSTETEPGNLDILLLEVASDGAPVWSHAYGAAGSDSGRDVAVDAAGEIVATGSLDVSDGPSPGVKIWTGRFDPAGAELWSSTTEDDGSGSAVFVDGDGLSYVTGSVDGSFGPEVWLQKRDAAGAEAWTIQDVYASDSSCDLNYHQDPEGVVVEGDSVYVAWRKTCPGGSFPAVPRSVLSHFTADAGEVLYNPDSCCLHYRFDVLTPALSAGFSTAVHDMALGPDGSIVLSGRASTVEYLWGYGPQLETGEVFNAAQWEAAPVFNDNDMLVSVAVDSAGNIVAVSSRASVVKTTAEGSLIWEVDVDARELRGVAIGEADAIFVVGTVAEEGESDDVWLARLAP